ncbi:MAG: lipopolysaccharide transport periplasmic protein LptA [Candidatus Rokuibacteriota bacterium]
MAGIALMAALLAPSVGAGQAARPAPKSPGPAQPRPTSPEDRAQPVTVHADNMERLGKESLIIFTGKVVARQEGSVQKADRMEVYLDEKGDRILRTVSIGNVRIVTGDCRIGTARRAEYDDLEQRMVLIGDARVWQDDNVVTGDTITLFLSQDRSVVQAGKQERVTAVFYPKSQDAPETPRPAARQSCE